MRIKLFVIFIALMVASLSTFAQLDTNFEAEDDTNFTALTPTFEIKTGTTNASGGAWVKLSGSPNGSLTLTVGSIPTAGAYKLNIYSYNNNAVLNADLSINGAASTNIVLNAGTWEYQGPPILTSLDVTLIEGTNTFTFTRTEASLHFDYFSITLETPEPPVPTVTTYYISDNDGNDTNDGLTEGTPWQTIAKATAAAKTISNGGLLLPGSKLLFKKGDTFIGQFNINCSGTLEDPIEFGSYGTGELPIITGVGAAGGDKIEVIKMTNTSHILMNDLWIKNDRQDIGTINWGTNSSYGIYVKATKSGGVSKGLTFRNLKITDIFAYNMLDFNGDFTLDWYTAKGIYFKSDEDDQTGSPTIDIGIDDVLIEDCYFYNLGSVAIGTGHGTNIRNNPVDEEDRNKNYVVRNNHFEKLGGFICF